MEITSSMVYQLLTEKYPVYPVDGSSDDIIVDIPRLLIKESPSQIGEISPTLYICDDTETIESHNKKDVAYLIRGAPCAFSLPKGCAAAFFVTEMDLANILYAVLDVMQRLQKWNLSLTEAVSSTSPFSNMLELLAPIYPHPLMIIDKNYAVAGYTKNCITNGLMDDYIMDEHGNFKMPEWEINKLLLNPEISRLSESHGVYISEDKKTREVLLCLNIYSSSNYVARIMSYCPFASPGTIQLFKHLCRFVYQTQKQNANDLAQRRQMDRLHKGLKSILTGENKLLSVDSISFLDDYQWQADNKYSIFVFRFNDETRFDLLAMYLCNRLETAWAQSCAVKHRKEVVWLVNHTYTDADHSKSMTMKQALAYIVRDLVCMGGSSDAFYDADALQIYYRQAAYALETGQVRNPHKWLHTFIDYKTDYVANAIQPFMEKNHIYHHGVESLIQLDKENGTQLCKALYNYIKCQFNVTYAAEKSYVHRSTFNRYLNQITEITHINWAHMEDLDELILVLLSLKLLM